MRDSLQSPAVLTRGDQHKEQERRFQARLDDPLRQWKLSPRDLPSREKWYDYSRARDRMLEATDMKHAPWYIVHSDDKKRARLNCMAHPNSFFVDSIKSMINLPSLYS